jgi:hypothetical protein
MKRALLWAVLGLLACSRRAEIENVPDAGAVVMMEPPRPDGGVPVVADAPLQNADGLTCAERPIQAECRGANDFPCDFDGWLRDLAEICQQRTQCTDGWLEVQLGPDGCAAELRMEDPDPPYVACITAALSKYRCPCNAVLSSRFLGLGHGDCSPPACGTGEFRCPAGSICDQGQCVPDDAAAGGTTDG